MITRLLTGVLIGLLPTLIFAQNELARSLSQLELRLAYHAELFVHPGVKIGIGYPFVSKEKSRTVEKKSGSTINRKLIREWVAGANFTFYDQRLNHRGYYYNLELTYRRIKNKSLKPQKFKYFDWNVAAGPYVYRLSGKTYRFEEGTFQEKRGRGTAFMPSLSFAFGTGWNLGNRLHARYYFKPIVAFEVPFNQGSLLHLALESGLAFSFRSISQNSKR